MKAIATGWIGREGGRHWTELERNIDVVDPSAGPFAEAKIVVARQISQAIVPRRERHWRSWLSGVPRACVRGEGVGVGLEISALAVVVRARIEYPKFQLTCRVVDPEGKTIDDCGLRQVVRTIRQQIISVPVIGRTKLARLAEGDGGLSVAAVNEHRV